MPATSFDPYEPGGGNTLDPVGNSPDWSAYFGLSPGGRFPGDLAFLLETIAARDPGPGRDPGSPDPDYSLPEWVENIPGTGGRALGWLARLYELNRREGGIGDVTNPLESGPAYYPWSGIGAGYGPEGGPLHGLLDQGGTAIQDRDYGNPNLIPRDGGNDRPRGGGGGGPDFGAFNFQPYGGTPFQSSFVGWQPTQPFMQASGPTTMVPGRTATPQVPPPSARPPGAVPRPPAGGSGRGAGDRSGPGGAGRGRRPAASQGPPPAVPPGGEQRPDGRILNAAGDTIYTPPAGNARPGAPPGRGAMSPEELLQLLFPSGQRGPHPTEFLREGGNRGYDAGMLDRGSPGWTRDPMTGVRNTAGMPLPTIPGQRAGESADEYITRLHDAGFDNESILGVLSGWGTGGVVRTPDGQLMFQNQYDERLAREEDANRRASENALSAIGGGGLGPLADLFSFGGGYPGVRY